MPKKLFKLRIPINVLFIFHKNTLFIPIFSMTIPTKTKPIYNNHNNGHKLRVKISRNKYRMTQDNFLIEFHVMFSKL
jgi:hypothetical protein